ncbi:MAG: DUF1738 domain-containing protein [Phycisphaerae bacterium]|nr:DUF1738 domain-containing protein [Phycisphaerae bacterium]
MSPTVKTDFTRQAMDELMAAVETGHSARLTAYLSMMARFHQYSLGNVLLIGLQCPQASRVGGYHAWKQLGRRVRKGERGIRILVPVVHRRKSDDEDAVRVVAFRTACVFDVSQTEGKPLPELGRVGGDPGTFAGRLKALVADHGIELEYMDLAAGVDGWSSGGRIGIRHGLSRAEEFSVLVHEFAHELLHRSKADRGARAVRETEAEAVAFVVCEAIGLDTNTAAADYIHLYDGNRDTLLTSLGRIQRTASTIIAGLTTREESGRTTGEPLFLMVKRPAAYPVLPDSAPVFQYTIPI